MAGDSLLLGELSAAGHGSGWADLEAEGLRVARINHEAAERELSMAALAEEVARLRYVAVNKALGVAIDDTQKAKARANTARIELAARLAGTP